MTCAHTHPADYAHSWRKQKGIDGCVVFVPPHSPELHAVIEHAHGCMVQKYERLVQQWAVFCKEVPTPIKGFCDEVEQCFRDGVSPHSIKGNVRKLLTQVYEAVVGLRGNRPPKNLR